jgi:hypothetical protein
MRDSYFSTMSSLGESYYGQTVQASSYVGKETTSFVTVNDMLHIAAASGTGLVTFGMPGAVIGGLIGAMDPLLKYFDFESSDHNYISKAFIAGCALHSLYPKSIDNSVSLMDKVDYKGILPSASLVTQQQGDLMQAVNGLSQEVKEVLEKGLEEMAENPPATFTNVDLAGLEADLVRLETELEGAIGT